LPSGGALWHGPLAEFFRPAREDFHKTVLGALQLSEWAQKGHDEDYPERVYTQFLERLLFQIRQRRHGGTVLIVPDSIQRSDSRLADRLLFKYAADYPLAWQLLLHKLMSYRAYYHRHDSRPKRSRKQKGGSENRPR